MRFVGIISLCGRIGCGIWCVAADYMLGGRPSLGWQLCFSLWLHAGWLDIRLYEGSDLKTYLLMSWWGPDALADVRPPRSAC